MLAHILFIFLMFFGYKTDTVNLCQDGVVDGIDRAIVINGNFLVHNRIGDKLYFIDDNCYGPLKAYQIDGNEITPYEG